MVQCLAASTHWKRVEGSTLKAESRVLLLLFQKQTHQVDHHIVWRLQSGRKLSWRRKNGWIDGTKSIGLTKQTLSLFIASETRQPMDQRVQQNCSSETFLPPTTSQNARLTRCAAIPFVNRMSGAPK